MKTTAKMLMAALCAAALYLAPGVHAQTLPCGDVSCKPRLSPADTDFSSAETGRFAGVFHLGGTINVTPLGNGTGYIVQTAPNRLLRKGERGTWEARDPGDAARIRADCSVPNLDTGFCACTPSPTGRGTNMILAPISSGGRRQVLCFYE